MTVLGRELSASSNKCFHLQSKKCCCCCCCCCSLFSFISVYSRNFFSKRSLFFSVYVIRSILSSLITFCIKSRICFPYFFIIFFFSFEQLLFSCLGVQSYIHYLKTEGTFATGLLMQSISMIIPCNLFLSNWIRKTHVFTFFFLKKSKKE